MTQLLHRANQHGISALFTRQEYVVIPESRPKMRLGGSALVNRSIDGFLRTTSRDDVFLEFNGVVLISMEDQSDLYSVSISVQQSEEGSSVALGQVHLRNDSDVTEYERLATV